jgi:hypothetical protein
MLHRLVFSFIALTLFTFAELPAKSKVYKPGEVLEYKMYYGWISAGLATLNLQEKVMSGDTLHYVKMKAKSTGLTDKLYKVNDNYESIFSRKTGLPVLAVRDIHEGKFSRYETVVYNHEQDTIFSSLAGKVGVPDNTMDVISAFYKVREMISIDRKVLNDSIVRIETWFDKELFPLILRYKGKETITTDLGTIKCLKFSPVVGVGRVFETQDDMTIWFSDDKNVIPVRMQFNLFIGSLKCDLNSHTGLKYPIVFN